MPQAVMMFIIILGLDGTPAPQPPAAEGPPLELAIDTLVVDMRRVQIGDTGVIATHEEASALEGVEGVALGDEFCMAIITITNPAEHPVVLSESGLRGLLLHRTEFSDADGRAWALTDLIRHAHLSVVHSVPVLNGSTKPVRQLLFLARFEPADKPAGAPDDAVYGHEVQSLRYRIRENASVSVRFVVDGRLTAPSRLAVVGSGACAVTLSEATRAPDAR